MLSFLLPLGEAELALDGNLVAFLHVLGDCLGAGSEHRAIDEIGVILPLAGLRVATAVVDGEADREDGGTACGSTELGVTGEVRKSFGSNRIELKGSRLCI